MEKILAIQSVRQNWKSLKDLDQNFRCNYDVVSAAVENYGKAIQFASFNLRDNETLARLALKSCPSAYKYLSSNLRNNKELCLISSCVYERAIFLGPKKWRADKEFLLELFSVVTITNSYKWSGIWGAHKKRIKIDMLLCGYVPNNIGFEIPIDIWVRIIQKNGIYIRYVPKYIISRELILIALNSIINYNKHTFNCVIRGVWKYIPKTFHRDLELMLKLIEADESFLQEGTLEIPYTNRQFVSRAIFLRIKQLHEVYPHTIIYKNILCKNVYFIPITNNILTNKRFIGEMSHSVHGNRKLLYIYGAIKAVELLPYHIGTDILDILSNARW